MKIYANSGDISVNGKLQYTTKPTFNNNLDVVTKHYTDSAVGRAVGEIVNGTTVFKTRIKGGYTASFLEIVPDDNTQKQLRFWSSENGRSNSYFNINLNRKCKIINCPEPSASYDITTKYYVDNLTGPKTSLLTREKNTLVHGINEIYRRLEAEVWHLSSLGTTEKNSLIHAINEVLRKVQALETRVTALENR